MKAKVHYLTKSTKQKIIQDLCKFNCCCNQINAVSLCDFVISNMLYTILLTLGGVAAAMLLLSVRVIIKKNGRFSSQHIADSKAMRDRAITCATGQDGKAQLEAQNNIKKQIYE